MWYCYLVHESVQVHYSVAVFQSSWLFSNDPEPCNVLCNGFG